ncbi:MAG: hypothetical protein QXU76_03995 [Candidatus Bilamarchaeaceae archaeon]
MLRCGSPSSVKVGYEEGPEEKDNVIANKENAKEKIKIVRNTIKGLENN